MPGGHLLFFSLSLYHDKEAACINGQLPALTTAWRDLCQLYTGLEVNNMPRSKGVPYTPRRETANEMQRTEAGAPGGPGCAGSSHIANKPMSSHMGCILGFSTEQGRILCASPSPCGPAADTVGKHFPTPMVLRAQ